MQTLSDFPKVYDESDELLTHGKLLVNGGETAFFLTERENKKINVKSLEKHPLDVHL